MEVKRSGNGMSDSILTATGSKYVVQNYEIKNLDNLIRYFTLSVR
jgi:hypothetical protein